MSTETQILLDNTTDARKRRKILRQCSVEELEAFYRHYMSWAPVFPDGARRARQCEKELTRRRITESYK